MATQSLNMPYLLLAGVLTVALVMFFALFQPMIATLNQLQADTATQTATLQEKRDFLSSLDQKRNFLAAQAPTEKKMSAMLPEQDQIEDALRIINVAASESGGTIPSLKNVSQAASDKVTAQRSRGEAAAVPAGADVLALELQFNGNYQQWRSFLQKITASPRLMDIQTISIRRSGDNPDLLFNNLTVDFYKLRVTPNASL